MMRPSPTGIRVREVRELWSRALHGKKWIERDMVLDGGWAPQND